MVVTLVTVDKVIVYSFRRGSCMDKSNDSCDGGVDIQSDSFYGSINIDIS